MDTVKVTINGEVMDVPIGMTVLQACELAGLEIPRFCYHERLSVAGNCRMCLVEVKPGPPKPQASCALPVTEGQEIFTDSEMARKARHGVMEFLLINHPLDCPICDQGGECDLQDQAMAYGRGLSRYDEAKRSVDEKYMGPLIKTVMTRCIHCTRCVRFSDEVAGVDTMGLLSRGENAEISTLERAIASELSGNLIDLCPVGALTSGPYAFHARSWELAKTESIDVSSAEGANIRIDVRGNEVMRILPRLNESVNEEWISDVGRFCCDGLKRQRLDRVYVRDSLGKMRESSWADALSAIAKVVADCQPEQIAALAGGLQDVESMYALKLLFKGLGSDNIDCRQDGMVLGGGSRQSYLFNSGIVGLDEADVVLLVGANPRHESPLINARIRKNWLERDVSIGFIGELPTGGAKLNYGFEHLGVDYKALQGLIEGRGKFATALKNAQRPMIIVGNSVVCRDDAGALLSIIADICDSYKVVKSNWNGYNILHRDAGRVGGLDIGFTPTDASINSESIISGARLGRLKLLYLLGVDDVDIQGSPNCLVVYQGHHGDRGAEGADIILPSAAYSEKDAIYVNLEGRVQMAQRAAFPCGDARADWAIIRALSESCGHALPFDDLAELRYALYDDFPHLRQVGGLPKQVAPMTTDDIRRDVAVSESSKLPFDTLLSLTGYDFYLSNCIARASQTMRQCHEQFCLGAGGEHD